MQVASGLSGTRSGWEAPWGLPQQSWQHLSFLIAGLGLVKSGENPSSFMISPSFEQRLKAGIQLPIH